MVSEQKPLMNVWLSLVRMKQIILPLGHGSRNGLLMTGVHLLHIG